MRRCERNMTRYVEYIGGPLDGEREAIEMARDPDGHGSRWALPERLTVPSDHRPDLVHSYRLGPCGRRYRHTGYARLDGADENHGTPP